MNMQKYVCLRIKTGGGEEIETELLSAATNPSSKTFCLLGQPSRLLSIADLAVILRQVQIERAFFRARWKGGFEDGDGFSDAAVLFQTCGDVEQCLRVSAFGYAGVREVADTRGIVLL